ncbi:hypothetical protein BV20DRAFT_973631 [Pilatotrama ljubarskyi]|nr:hypothetical protein BV20DRAFT_973631 [Pilatotrama ljubarskyi]
MHCVEDASLGVPGYRVCLMCTFDNTPLEDLPTIFQDFCVLVYLEDMGFLDDIHLHSLPEWPAGKAAQLIIAWPYQTTRRLISRWFVPEGFNER